MFVTKFIIFCPFLIFRNSEDNGEHSEGASSPGWEEDYKAWEAKFRCTNFKTTKKHSGGMKSVHYLMIS